VPDLFRGLVPAEVHASASLYSERKAALVRAALDAAETVDASAESVVDGSKLRRLLEQVRGMRHDGPPPQFLDTGAGSCARVAQRGPTWPGRFLTPRRHASVASS